ncbi:2'-5' RNA ligase family protein [Chryseobacterium sp. FH1]|uniref:2'-5' RNA ligase family protein n=1 Tax=Chryseobacterium sp. FH1 TaxID=1233951 RepID=UPI0004E4236E|nr:2'-5' RNA ligase family protein [Chryseobacterium sp. FH1]KFC19650.1 hypothetical protein IO90_10270 [Chryseobacterium sp. FH1]
MNKIRRQLTLFLDDHYSTEIETIRRKYNPDQYKLIRSHVTLCREDEIEDLAKIKINISQLDLDSIRINFDQLMRFSNQKGVMISAKHDNHQYHYLRQAILKDCNIPLTFPYPHITLMHPRNSTCTDEIFDEIKKIKIPESILFKEFSLIQQTDDNEWELLETFQM